MRPFHEHTWYNPKLESPVQSCQEGSSSPTLTGFHIHWYSKHGFILIFFSFLSFILNSQQFSLLDPLSSFHFIPTFISLNFFSFNGSGHTISICPCICTLFPPSPHLRYKLGLSRPEIWLLEPEIWHLEPYIQPGISHHRPKAGSHRPELSPQGLKSAPTGL